MGGGVLCMYTADRGQYKIIAYVLAMLCHIFNGYVIAAYSSPYLEFYNTFAGMSYLDEMLYNRKAWHIRQLAGKRPCKI